MSKEHLAVMVLERAEQHADRTAMRIQVDGQWQSTSYREMSEAIRRLARALLASGVKAGDRVGIFSRNRPEWSLADFATACVGAVSVPIYATNTTAQAAYIVDEAEIALLFVGDQGHYDKARSLLGRSASLTTIIVFDETVPINGDESKTISQFSALGDDLSLDAEIDARLDAASPDDLTTIIYTSGTTGEPKGVMLNHANLFHQFKAMEGEFTVGPADRSLCFLPLSHVYERAWTYYIYRSGAENNYLENPREVIETLAEVQPTVMSSVPRLYEKIYATATHNLEQGSGLKKKLFHWSLDVGKRYQYALREQDSVGTMLSLQHKIADRLVLSKIRAVMGGPKNFVTVGGAPLSASIEEFFFAAGLLVCEGYGLTETSPMISYNTPNAFKFGSVGKPIPGCEVRIAEDGEVQAKSPSVTAGYYRKPEATAEAFVDGWFRTGDIGEFDDEGFLRITDRIKALIITSGGKNIAPQRIETIYAQDIFIEQFIAIGDRRQFISALIVPNFEALEAFAKDEGIEYKDHKDLVKYSVVRDLYQQRIDALAGELAEYEQVKSFVLLSAPFAQETGELTPTQKLKRSVVVEKYAEEIEAMYGS